MEKPGRGDIRPRCAELLVRMPMREIAAADDFGEKDIGKGGPPPY